MDINPESPIFTCGRVITEHKKLIVLKRKFENWFISDFTAAAKSNSTYIENITKNFE
jgi:hypothetical protein